MTDNLEGRYILPPPSRPSGDTPALVEADKERYRQATKARVDAAIAERQREDAELADQRERDRIERGRQALADYEGQAHQRHLHNGGTEADWPAVWRELKTKYLAERTGMSEVERHEEILRASGQFTRM